MIAQNIDNKKLTDREEAFCEWKARCNIADVQAYRNAGYKDGKNARQAAHKLIIKDYIIARIAEIKALRERKVVVTPQSVALEAEDQRVAALGIGDLKAANAALVIKAKAYGCQTDKTETIEHETPITPEMEREYKRAIAIIMKQDSTSNTNKAYSLEDNEQTGGHSPSLTGQKQR